MGSVKPATPDKREALAKDRGVNLSNWVNIPEDSRGNISGETPHQKERLFGDESNASVAKRLGVTERQASKIRNHKRPIPSK